MGMAASNYTTEALLQKIYEMEAANAALREKEILLSLNEDMATIRDRHNLWRVMREKLKPLVNFKDAVVTYYSKDCQSFAHLLGTSEKFSTDAKYKSHFDKFYPIADTPAEYLIKRKGNFLWTTEEMAKRYPHFETIPYMLENSYHYNVHFKLHWAGADIGYFHFHFTESGDFDEAKMPFYKAVADQVAVAVANILANEEIIEREQEKTKLLSISEHIAQIKNRRELLEVVFTAVREVLPYDDVGLFYFCDRDGKPNPAGECHLHLSRDVGSELNKSTVEIWQELLTSHTDVIRFCAAEKPRLTTIDELEARFPGHPYYPELRADGIRQFISQAIKANDQTIGMLSFNSRQEDFYKGKDFSLFENICNQISVAVANILANEEIIEREREKALLLSLSEDMATIRDRDDLWRVMMEKLRPIVGFDDAVVIVLSPDLKLSKTILTMSKGQRSEQPWYQYIKDHWIPTTEPLAYIYNLKTGYWSTEAILDRWADFEGGLFMRGESLLHSYQVSLKQGGAEIGLLLFHFRERAAIQPSKYNLYKAIGDQVAVAVANILANEEILERGQEKAVLLAISREMVKVRERKELLAAINRVVKSAIPFDEMAVYVIDPDRRHYRLMYDDFPADKQTAQVVRQMMQGLPLQNSRIAEVVFADRPAFILTREEMLANAPEAGANYVEATDIENVICAPLKFGGQVIGCFNVTTRRKHFFTPELLPLYQGIADQIAVAVANILANEEIIDREREKSTLLTISEDIASIKDRNHLFEVIAAKIKPIFNFDHSVIFIADRERDRYWMLLVKTKDERDGGHLFDELRSGELPLKGSIEEWIINHDEAFICSADEFASLFPDAPGVSYMRQVGIQDGMLANLRNGGKIIGSFHLHSDKKDFFQVTQLQLFQAVADQIAVAVANILANEEIVRLAEERRLRAEELERTNFALQNSTLQLSSLEDIDLFVQKVLVEINRETGAKGAAIFQVTPDGKYLRMSHYVEGSQILDLSTDNRLALFREMQSPVNDPASERLLQGEVLWTDYRRQPERADESWAETFAFHQMMGHKTVAALPFVIGGEFTGFLGIGFGAAVKPTDGKMQLCKTLAQHVALALNLMYLSDEAKQSAVAREQEKAARSRAAALARTNETLSYSLALLARETDLSRLLGQMLTAISERLNAVSATFWLYDAASGCNTLTMSYVNGQVLAGEDLPEFQRLSLPVADWPPWREMQQTGRPMVFADAAHNTTLNEVNDWLAAEGVKTLLIAPLMLGSAMLGTFGIHRALETVWTEDEISLAQAMGHQISLAVQLTRLAELARREAEVGAIAEERNRFARDIHDTLAQSFTALLVQLQGAVRLMDSPLPEVSAHLARAEQLARDGLQEARRSARALRPLALEGDDLPGALRRLLEHVTTGTDVTGEFVQAGRARTLPNAVNLNLLRVCQEALTNALRHADPNRIEVELGYQANGDVRLTIADDGHGFDADRDTSGLGLLGMRERASELDAELSITSQPGVGTRVSLVATTEFDPATESR